MLDNPCEGGPVVDDSGQEPRMIGDFESSANALWSLYGKEAKSHDEARIQTLKDDMDGVLIFVRPYFLCVYSGLRHTDIYLYRLVYFPLPLRRSSLIASRTCKLTPQTKWCITFDNIQPSFPRSPNNSRPLLHRFPSPLLHHPLSLLSIHQHQISV